MNLKHTLALSAFAATIVLVCSGCTALTSALSPDAVADDSALNISDSNPWRAEFTRSFHESDDPFVRGVLADGTVTGEEHTEGQARFADCLKRSGIDVGPGDKNGAEELFFLDGLPSGFNPNAATDECMRSSGHAAIVPLYILPRANPADEPGLALQCLQDRGVVDPGLTIERFNRKIADWNFLRPLGKDLGACIADPKGAQQ